MKRLMEVLFLTCLEELGEGKLHYGGGGVFLCQTGNKDIKNVSEMSLVFSQYSASCKLLWLQSVATIAEILASVRHCAKSLWNTKELWRSARPCLCKADLLSPRFPSLSGRSTVSNHHSSAGWKTHAEKPKSLFFSARTTGPIDAQLQLLPPTHTHKQLQTRPIDFKALPVEDEPTKVLEEAVRQSRQLLVGFLISSLSALWSLMRKYNKSSFEISVNSLVDVASRRIWCPSNCC